MQTNKLHNIKETGFKVPKGYFDNLEDTVLRHIKLKELSSESGFKTPENYFDSLEDSILNKASEKESTKVISIFSRRNLIYASSIAAAVLLLFNLSVFEKNITFDSLDVDTAENYIMNEIVDSYEFATLFSEEALTEDNFIDYDFNEETIEAYIINNIDIEDLMVE
tara:strand:- start:1650 stop:2147 length:498 start_codon:yes stop_codon:yes gene_type:complete